MCVFLGLLQSDERQEDGKPSWKHSILHVIVATLSSFLFGYHLGSVDIYEIYQLYILGSVLIPF